MEKKKIAVTVCGVVLAAGCVASAVFAVRANGELSSMRGQIDTVTASNASLSSEIEAANSRIETLENALPGVEVQALMKSAFEEYNKVDDMVKGYEITSKTDVAGLAIEVPDETVAEEIQYMREHCPEGKYLPEDLEQIYITEREHFEEILIRSIREELLKIKQGLIDSEAKAAAERERKEKEEADRKKDIEQSQQTQPTGGTSTDSGNGGSSGSSNDYSGSTGGNEDYSGGASTDSGSGGGNDDYSGGNPDDWGDIGIGGDGDFTTGDSGDGDFSDIIFG